MMAQKATSKKSRILFTATFSTPFIKEDLRILEEHFDVSPILTTGWQTFFRYCYKLLSSDISFSWFASVYSSSIIFLARLFGKKSIIILGGVDVANEIDIGYGIWNTPWKARVVRYGLHHATAVIAVDEFLKKEAIRLANYDGANIHVIHFGFDETKWLPGSVKENFILTVGACPDMARIKKKGVDVLLRVAAQMTDIPFVIVGIAESVQSMLRGTPNVSFYPHLQQSELLPLYQRAKVFCQLSLHEGMPNTLCEAMLCECIPVGSNRSGIPNAIGQTGFVVEYNNIDETIIACKKALSSSPGLGYQARQRVISEFHVSRREKELTALVISLLQ